ncbi:MAG TPA: DUF3300 domain-containing protein [Steroidobacter sp.]|uniref:DUF3300 domain-containing protein n=1 Tax=Steroidobacter sp. TaxID=1978227 RepID=UPI002ED968C7
MSTRAWPRPFLLALLPMLVLAACGSDQKQPVKTQAAPNTDATSTSRPATPPPPAVTQASWAPDALEELLAPIALYPDQLLTQILAASINAQEVLDGGNWLLDHQQLQGEALDAAARQAGFGAAMRSLLQFPTVVDMLCQQIDWTRQLGSAFSSDQKSVLDAVQRLRLQAAQVGNLQSTPEQTVETKTETNHTIIEVKPANPQVVYVPQYNPQVVYTTPPPAPAPATTASDDDTVSTETAVAAGLIGFGVGALIGHALDDDDDYCCYPNWGHSTVIVGARPFYPPAYAYRPAYGAGFRPAYRYAPPAGYRYNSANYQGDRYGRATNINVDNTNYFNRFENNQNLRAGTAESPLSTATGERRAQRMEGGREESWKGQSSYRGARDDATTQRLNQAAGVRGASDRAYAQSSGALRDTSTERVSSTSYSPGERARGSSQSASRPDRSPNVDRGYGDQESLQSRQQDIPRSAPDIQRAAPEMQRSMPETRTVADIQRPEPSTQRADTAARAQERSGDSAFSGARDSGSFERSASARGRASGGRAGGGRRR